MLLPDNIQPELSIYYNGALVLKELQENESKLILDIYQSVKDKYDMNFSIFTLSLDWLFLANIAVTTMKGEIELCS